MGEYEEFAQAAVAALQAANQPMWTDVLAAIGGLSVGLLQCGLIYVGLRRMGAAADRKAQHEETMPAPQHQYEESLMALKTLIERTASRT